jgi:hypothetical protein
MHASLLSTRSISPVADHKMTVNIEGGGSKNGTKIILWDNSDANNSQWYIRLSPDAISNSPDWW